MEERFLSGVGSQLSYASGEGRIFPVWFLLACGLQDETPPECCLPEVKSISSSGSILDEGEI